MNCEDFLHRSPLETVFPLFASSSSDRTPTASRRARLLWSKTSKRWEARLNDALGTVSPDFVRSSLLQIQSAARSPYGTVSELAINAALAMVEAAAPTDEIEGALAIQMACTHAAAMSVLGKMDSGFGTERRIAAFGSTAARLMRTFTMQVEVLRRLRHGGHQYVRVDHVHVNDGGQALIGNVKRPDR
jgi:hypothetical protein